MQFRQNERFYLSNFMPLWAFQDFEGIDLDEIIEQKSSESLVKLMTQKSSYLDFFYNYSISIWNINT